MNLNSISIGGGLALVAVGLLANAAASLVGSPDRTAHADDLNRAAKNPQPVADVAVSRADEMRRAIDGTPPTMPMGGGDGCVEGEPLNWFGEIREFPSCVLQYDTGGFVYLLMGTEDLRYCDVNGDAKMEGFRSGYTMLISDGVPLPPTPVLSLELTQIADSDTNFTHHPVLISSALIDAANFVGETTVRAAASAGGWRDMDNDGDKDCVVVLNIWTQDFQGMPWFKYVWLENTGFEATQPLVGDLDGDGSVGASDLTMLLGGWTGN